MNSFVRLTLLGGGETQTLNMFVYTFAGDGDSYATLMLKWSTDLANYIVDFGTSCQT